MINIAMEELIGSNGKAHRVVDKNDGCVYLFSYCTPIMVYKNDRVNPPKPYRYNFRESATTSKHIKLFCEMNKKEFMKLPLIED